MAVAVLTPVPSPYQVELFDAIAAGGRLDLRVVYLSRRHAARRWAFRRPAHDHVICDDGETARATSRGWVRDADAAVFSWYATPEARSLLGGRAASGRPWCYWGERPGSRRLPVLGRIRRRVRLGALRRSLAPIWGIGTWAVEGWKREFGASRPYRNVPYYSDLARFHLDPVARPVGRRRLLFSGSLIRRKGVDLLADAFARVANERPSLELDIVGAGEAEPALRRRLAGLDGRVRFHGFRDWQDLPACYHDADVLVAPSRYDGWGLIVPEGLAAGLPVIATDQMGSARDLIRSGENGWSVRAGSVADLMNVFRIVADLSDAGLAEMSAAARRSVAAHTLTHGVQVFEQAVVSLCRQSSRAD